MRESRQDRSSYRKLASMISAGSGSSVKGVEAPELEKLDEIGVAMPDADSDIKRTL